MKETKKEKLAREYHSTERIEWVKAQPCVACGEAGHHLREAHHTRNGGLSRKAGYETIVPLCHVCHYEYHALGRDTFRKRAFITKTWAELAAETHARWLEYLEGME